MQKKKLGKVSAVALVAAVSLVGSIFSATSQATAATKVTVGIAYDLGGRSTPGFNQLAYLGVKPYMAKHKNVGVLELQASLSDTDDVRAERLRQLVKKGCNPIVAVGFLYGASLKTVAAEYPKVKFGIIDDSSVTAPNVQSILFKEQEGSFLVGVIAAMKSKTGNIGFIGGVKTAGIQKFEAGYEAGAKAINPKIVIQSNYISSPPDFSGFNDPAKGKESALGMYQNGADIVYAAAGGTGGGVHQAAFAQMKMSIGVDADEALFASNKAVKGAIITSMLKRVDTGTLAFITAAIENKWTSGVKTFGLANGGVGYSTTGGFITTAIKAKVDALSKQILSGKIVVPEVPSNA